MYSASVFLTTLSSFIFIRLLKNLESINSKIKNQNAKLNLKIHSKLLTNLLCKQNYLPYILVNIALVYTDYYGWLVVFTQGIVLLCTKRFRLFLISNSLFLLFYLPWLNMLITQMQAGVQATHTLPVWVSLVNLSILKAIPLTFIKFAIGRISFPDKHFYFLVIVVVTVVYIVLGILGGLGYLGRLNKKITRPVILSYLILWFFIPLMIAWLVSFKVPNFQPFRLLLILPAFHILTIYLISNIQYPSLRRAIITMVIMVNLGGYLYFQLTPSMHREDWRGLTGFTDRDKATLVIPSESSNWPVRYYTNGGTQLVYGATGAEQVSQPPAISGNIVYYLRYLVPVFDPGEKLVKQLQTLGYNKTDTINFNQLEVWRYQRNNF